MFSFSPSLRTTTGSQSLPFPRVCRGTRQETSTKRRQAGAGVQDPVRLTPAGQLFPGRNLRVCLSRSRSQGNLPASQADCGGCEGTARQQPPQPRAPTPKGCFLLLRGQRQLWAPPAAIPAATLCRAPRMPRRHIHGNAQNAVTGAKTPDVKAI